MNKQRTLSLLTSTLTKNASVTPLTSTLTRKGVGSPTFRRPPQVRRPSPPGGPDRHRPCASRDRDCLQKPLRVQWPFRSGRRTLCKSHGPSHTAPAQNLGRL